MDPAEREAMERQHAEDRKSFDREELLTRRRVDAMEAVAWRFLFSEKERRLAPERWAQKYGPPPGTVPGQQTIYIKLMNGNRALQPLSLAITNATKDTTVAQLKELIRAQVAAMPACPISESWITPSDRIRLFFNLKEIPPPVGVGQPPGTPAAPAVPPLAIAGAAPGQPVGPVGTPATVDPAACTLGSLQIPNAATLQMSFSMPPALMAVEGVPAKA